MIEDFNFEVLVTSINRIHEHLAAQAGKAVNIGLTLRNWMIGCYIQEYEQNGADRATYGEALLEILAEQLKSRDMNRVAERELRRYRQFYQTYPQIRETVSAELHNYMPGNMLHDLNDGDKALSPEMHVSADYLINSLSFSHFAELIAIDDPLKRTFYEVECIGGNWSVRELKRQIGSLYYERSGLSDNKEKLAERVRSGAEKVEPKLAIRDPYIFEFLDIKSKEVMSESNLEDSLLDKLESFLLELGNGFCFEARQKRILIGDSYGFVDLVFYHRILKCHVLVELKVAPFTHENLGQLNTYVSWYRKNMMSEGDNAPVGILLCSQKDQALVEYALAGMQDNLFVSKYQLQLPRPEELQKFIERNIRAFETE